MSFKRQDLFYLVRGYLPSSPQASDNLMGVDIAQEMLRDLNQKRQNLMLELKNYEENLKVDCLWHQGQYIYTGQWKHLPCFIIPNYYNLCIYCPSVYMIIHF